MLIATILISFFVLHVLGGAILQHSSRQTDSNEVVVNRAFN
jgi:hypothetical protein